MKMLLFGATSILGYNLTRRFPEAIIPFLPGTGGGSSTSDWAVLRLEDPGWIQETLDTYEPETLVYCHAVCPRSRSSVISVRLTGSSGRHFLGDGDKLGRSLDRDVGH